MEGVDSHDNRSNPYFGCAFFEKLLTVMAACLEGTRVHLVEA